MAQCETTGCTREGIIERSIEAPFTMISAIAESIRKVFICEVCHDQDERMKEVGRGAGLGKFTLG